MQQIEIDMNEVMKEENRIWVKPTATRKGHYRKIKGAKKVEEGKKKEETKPSYGELSDKLLSAGEYGVAYNDKMVEGMRGTREATMYRSKPYNPFSDFDVETRDISYILSRLEKNCKDAGWGDREISNLKIDMISGGANHRLKIIHRECKE